MLLALVLLAARADDLGSFLARGPVVAIDTDAAGRVETVTAIARLDAAPDVVWARIVGFSDYVNWMPQVVESTEESRTGDVVVVKWAIATPGPNVNFKASYACDVATHTVKGVWVSGALEGSHWEWRVVAEGTGSLVYRTAFSTAVADNWLLSQFDDDAHTLELGLNAATPVVELQALEKALRQ